MSGLGRLLESYEEDEVLRLTFSDGAEFEYRKFEVVDETIYQDDSYVLGELLQPGKKRSFVQFQVHEIVRVKHVKSNTTIYERSPG